MDHSSNTDRIEHNLTVHPPQSPEVGVVMDELRAGMKELSHLVDRLVPDGREKSMALTDLEDACMHAIAGLARSQHLVAPEAADG